MLGKAWLAPLMLVALTAGCDGSVGVRGRILDPTGGAIAGAEVRLGRPGEALEFTGESEGDGCFAVGGMVSPGERDYLLTVSATGYQPYEGTYTSTGEYAVLVHLSREASAEASSATPLAQSWPAELDRCSFQGGGAAPENAMPENAMPENVTP